MTIQKNLSDVTERIRLAATECHRSPQDITLLAVSKTKPCVNASLVKTMCKKALRKSSIFQKEMI